MCTLALLVNVVPGLPVVVAGNRDERYARETDPPRVLAESPRVVGGRDVRGGGTWLAVSATGRIAAVTNFRTWHLPDPSRRSRGDLPLLLLRGLDVTTLDGRLYNPFDLVFGDATTGLFVAYGRESARIEVERVPDGIHVLANTELDSHAEPKIMRATTRVADLSRGRAEWRDLLPALATAFADHTLPSIGDAPVPPPGSPAPAEFARQLDAICVHTETYGTRSFSAVALAEGRVAHYHFAPGTPCVTPTYEVPATVVARSSSLPA